MKALVSLLLAGSVAAVSAGEPVIASPQWTAANTEPAGDQDNAAIAANRNGIVAVVWEDDRDSTNPGDDRHSDIWLHTFRNGAHLHELKVSTGGNSGVSTWRHINPHVGLDDRGNAVVVWSDDPDGNGYYNVA